MNHQIINIQKVFRGYKQRRKLLIPSSLYQTKNWRKNQKWYINGKKNECEKYQIEVTEKIIKKI
jgi:7,8-dihydro-6-hydroxymethylpterin-pyrophosphokinase